MTTEKVLLGEVAANMVNHKNYGNKNNVHISSFSFAVSISHPRCNVFRGWILYIYTGLPLKSCVRKRTDEGQFRILRYRFKQFSFTILLDTGGKFLKWSMPGVCNT